MHTSSQRIARSARLHGLVTLRTLLPACAAALVGLVLTGLAWALAMRHDAQVHQEALDLRALAIAVRIEAALESRQLALERMAARFGRGDYTNKASWEADADRYISDYPGYRAVKWADETWTVRWVVPLSGNESVQGLRLDAEPGRRDAIAKLISSGRSTATESVELVQGGLGFLMLAPIYPPSSQDNVTENPADPLGLIVGVFRIRPLLHAILSATDADDGFHLEVADPQRVLFARRGDTRGSSAEEHDGLAFPVGRATIAIRDLQWSLVVADAATLNNSALRGVHSAVPETVLGAGLLISCVLGGLVLQGTRVRQRETRLRSLHVDLAESKARLQRAVDGTNDAMWSLDLESGASWVTSRVREMLGMCAIHSAAVSPRGAWTEFLSHVDDGDRTDLETAIEECKAGEDRVDRVVSVRRVDGNRGWLRVRGRVDEIQPGDASGRRHPGTVIAGSIQDVTALTQAEVDLEDHAKQLEQRNRDLDDFAYVASHDLKSPLRAIRHLADWVRQDANGQLPPSAEEHLTTLQARIDRMNQLLNDLLAYARIGRDELELEPVDVSAMVDEIAATIDVPDGFEIRRDEPISEIVTNSTSLRVILQNLISNAIKHHDRPEQGWVGISLRAGDAGAWTLSVQDNGPGIDAVYHDRVFRIFQTLQSRDDVEGSGIGLAIVRKVAGSIGATVVLEPCSTGGSCLGCTFTVNCPRSRVRALCDRNGLLDSTMEGAGDIARTEHIVRSGSDHRNRPTRDTDRTHREVRAPRV